MLFTIDGERFALPLDTVAEIVSLPARSTTVERSGDRLFVVDGAELLGFGPSTDSRKHGIVVRSGDAGVVLAVDIAEGTATVAMADISPPPPRFTGATRSLVDGVFETADGRLVVVLDPTGVIAGGGAQG